MQTSGTALCVTKILKVRGIFLNSLILEHVDFDKWLADKLDLLKRIFGFNIDGDRAKFAALTTFSAWLAVLLASTLGLPNAHWAGVTVFTVAQPSRGLLIERCTWRLIGTVVGAGVGWLILITFSSQPIYLVICLTLWLTICAATTSVVKHFRRYGVLLAGFTAAIVALIDVSHPDNIGLIAFGRVSCTILGIVVTSIVSAMSIPTTPRKDLLDSVRTLSSRALENYLSDLSLLGHNAKTEVIEKLLIDIASIDAKLEELYDGSLGARWRKRRIRNALGSLLELARVWNCTMDLVNLLPSEECRANLALMLTRILFNAQGAINNGSLYKPPLNAASTALPGTVKELHKALATLIEDILALEHEATAFSSLPRIASEPDYARAIRASVRTGASILAVGMTWIATGWEAGSLMLLGAIVFVTVFSVDESGKANVCRIVPGVALGILAAFAYREWLIPSPSTIYDLILWLIPFMLISSVGYSFKALALTTIEYNNFFLMLSQPSHIAPWGLPILLQGSALLGGVLIAVAVLHYVLPLDTRHSRRLNLAAVEKSVLELKLVLSGDSHWVWRARLVARLLKLANQSGIKKTAAQIENALLILDIGMLFHNLSCLPESHSLSKIQVIESFKSISVTQSAPTELIDSLKLYGKELEGGCEPQLELSMLVKSCTKRLERLGLFLK